ncbi:MAG: hypothetical protein FWE53_03170 [Firmicutes bacterium]|nr:hypothetical protein [Bacillota bacterium]
MKGISKLLILPALMLCCGIAFVAANTTLAGNGGVKTVHAADGFVLASTITTYGLTAENVSATSVTVTGTKTNATSTLALNIDAGVTVVWKAELSGNTTLISLSGAGTFTVADGLISASGGYAIDNQAGSKVEVSGGEVSSVNLNAIYNDAGGTVTVSGGTVKSTGNTGNAIHNGTNGTVSISGTATVSVDSGRAIQNYANGTITVSGGTVSATTGTAIYNNAGGTITVSGGTVSVTGGTGTAIHNQAGGTVNVSGGTISTISGQAISNNTGTVNVSGTATVSATGIGGVAIYNQTGGEINVSGGTVEATGSYGVAIQNQAGGTINVSGGTIKAAIDRGFAIVNYASGTITISQTNAGISTLITSVNTNVNESTIYLGGGTLNINGGSITNTAGGNAIFHATSAAITIGKAEPVPTSPVLVKTYNDFGSISVGGNVIPGSPAEWYKVGDPNPIANAKSFTYTPKAVADSGAYTARVKNTFTGMINGTVQTLTSTEWSDLSAPIHVTIMPKIVVVTAMAMSKVQGTADPFLQYHHSSLVGDVSGNYVYIEGTLVRESGETVRTYNINLGSVRIYEEDEFGNTRESNNYAIIFSGNKFTITAAPTFLTGTVNPANTLGNNGDTYLNTATQDVFIKNSGTWAKAGNLKGMDGENGTDGKGIVSIIKIGTSGLVDTYTITFTDSTTTTFTITNGQGGTNGINGQDGTDGKDGLSGGAVAGIAVGSAVGSSAICLTLFWFLARKRKMV